MNQGTFQPYAFHVLVQLKWSGSNCMASLFWDVNIHLSRFPGTKFLFWNLKRCNSWQYYINIRLFCWFFFCLRTIIQFICYDNFIMSLRQSNTLFLSPYFKFITIRTLNLKRNQNKTLGKLRSRAEGKH